jgi:sugar lactone lactonase YvrE
MLAGLSRGTRTARRRRIAVLALAGIVLATAAVVAVALGNAGKHAGKHSVVTSLTADLADPGSKQVNSVAFSPDGKTLAIADENGRAYLWHIPGGGPG